MADKQCSTESRGLGEEEAKEPFTVDLGEKAVEEGVRQGILELVRHTAEGEPVFGFTLVGKSAMMCLLGHKLKDELGDDRHDE